MKKFSFILAIGMLAFVLAACGSGSSGSSQGSGEEQTETVTVEHELGTTEVPKNPENVAVFDFGILDTLDELGIPVSGVVQSSTMPSYLEEEYGSDEYTNIGALKEPDFEAIANANPDLIIISGRQASVYDQLSDIAPTIHLAVDNQNYMQSFKENMNIIGQIFDKQDEVDQALTAIDEQIATVQDKAESLGLNAMILMTSGDSVSAYGPGSRFGIIHDVLNIPATDQNIDNSTRHGMSVSFEYVMQQNPDMIYVIDRGSVTSGSDSQSTAQQLIENELVANTNAAQNDNIFYLDPATWYLSGGGLQSVSMMVNQINESLDQAAASTQGTGSGQGSGSESESGSSESQSGSETGSESGSGSESGESTGSESSNESGSESGSQQ